MSNDPAHNSAAQLFHTHNFIFTVQISVSDAAETGGADNESVSLEAWAEIERMQQETKQLAEKVYHYIEPEQLSLFE